MISFNRLVGTIKLTHRHRRALLIGYRRALNVDASVRSERVLTSKDA